MQPQQDVASPGGSGEQIKDQGLMPKKIKPPHHLASGNPPPKNVGCSLNIQPQPGTATQQASCHQKASQGNASEVLNLGSCFKLSGKDQVDKKSAPVD